MTLRVVHVSAFDRVGGAARAAACLHGSMLEAGIDSTFIVGRSDGSIPHTVSPNPRRFALAGMADRALWRLERSPRTTWRSPAVFGSLNPRLIRALQPDVVNLHWVTNGLLTVRSIGALASAGVPVAWSMYDLFPFAGSEHYDAVEQRYLEGYRRSNRPSDESGVDVDRWTWSRKQHHWRHPMTMVPASAWLEDCVRRSALMGAWPIARIPHVVDTETYGPMSMTAARSLLGLPNDRTLVLFLASAGIGDHRKGWDLLEPALTLLRRARPDVEAVVVGPPSQEPLPIPVRWLGEIHDDQRLRAAYAAADVVAVPSRADTMPLTAMEAQACGTPVVAFRIGGLPDIIDPDSTGALADPWDTKDLARALGHALDNRRAWGSAARRRAVRLWSPRIVAGQYQALYEAMVAR